MPTIQSKTSRGYKYWYIVESRRINGKPRPVVLAYLGKAEELLKKIMAGTISGSCQFKSYSHGLVSTLYKKAKDLNIVSTIDSHSCSQRDYVAQKPMRNGLTVGQSILLAAIGRACKPTSKQSWKEWASSTSLDYILGHDLGKLDSQHFWDHMDCIPVEAIEKIEADILKEVRQQYSLKPDTLLFDTTNFFTYIDSRNTRCEIAKRGKNKQKRIDLRQVGLACVVTKKDHIPLFHNTYEGNHNDYTTFREVIEKIKKRLVDLDLNFDKNTMVFDKGMNCQKNFELIDSLNVHYVTSLKMVGHSKLIATFKAKGTEVDFNGTKIKLYRGSCKIWGKKRTVVVSYSESFKESVLVGIMNLIEKKSVALTNLGKKIPLAKVTLSDERRKKQIAKIIGKKFSKIIKWSLTGTKLTHWIDEEELETLKSNLGIKILVTDRSSWDSTEIIRSYNGQAAVEEEFRNMKNPMHLTFRPQFHWTDQKIKVHYLICVIAHLLSTLLFKEAKEHRYDCNLNTLLDDLNGIRLGVFLKEEKTEDGKKAKMAPSYGIEEVKNEREKLLIDIFGITSHHSVG